MTAGSFWMSSGGPSAILRPSFSTTISSETSMTSPMSCSTTTSVTPPSRIGAQHVRELLGLGRVQAGGRLVEQQQPRAAMASARATSSSRRVPCGRSAAGASATSPSPTRRSRRSASSRASRSSRARAGKSQRGAQPARPRARVRARPARSRARSSPRRAACSGTCARRRARTTRCGRHAGDVAPVERRRVPRRRGRTPVSRLNSVDFPAPFGPMSAWIAPSNTSKETSSTAVRPPKRRVRPLSGEQAHARLPSPRPDT